MIAHYIHVQTSDPGSNFAKGHHRSSEAETQCLTGLVEPVPTLVEGQIAWLRSVKMIQNKIHIRPYPILGYQKMGFELVMVNNG